MTPQDRELTSEKELADLVRSLEEAQNDLALNGPIPPEQLQHMIDEAITRGGRLHEVRRGADRRIISRR